MPFRNTSLKDVIPPAWRKVIYPVWIVVAFIIGAIWVWAEAANTPVPDWLVPFGAVWMYVGVGTNAIAAANVNLPSESPPATPPGRSNDSELPS